MAILECILIDASANEIKLMANDMELGIETRIEGVIEDDADEMARIIEKVFTQLTEDQKSGYGAGGSLHPDRICTSAGERTFLYAGMESGWTFQRSCFTNGKGVCMADE